MGQLRILIVTHAPLSPEFGAAQMAINLAEAFQEQGHDVTLWSPHPLPPRTNWWQKLQPWREVQYMQTKLEAFINTQKTFDLIDMPGGTGLINHRVCKSASVVVARSVQPSILYLVNDLKLPQLTLQDVARNTITYLYTLFFILLVIQDWRRAKYIFCLGSLEFQWMTRWFPWWRSKLRYYINALSKSDQETLSKIRSYRQIIQRNRVRFLWIGRWVSHKGIDNLHKFIIQRATSHPQDIFTIAGCGVNAEKDLPSQLIQSGYIKIIPSFERNQLYSLLDNHDIGLFTSKVEGWGLVLNEMLESGMTVFATPAGGVPDLQPFFQETLKPFESLSQSVINLSTDSINLENYYKTFTWKKIAEHYIAILNDL